MSEFPLIYLTENPENDKLVIFFLKKVHDYYPVGLCDFRKKYPGSIEIAKIVLHKFDVECNDPGSLCNVFVSQLKANLTAYVVMNQNHLHFPNYSASVLVANVNNESYQQETFIEIYISLLCDYYTIFMVDLYRFKEKHTERNKVKNTHTIYSLKEIYGEQYDGEIALIKKLVHQYFPQKEFISHVFLTRHHVQSVEPFNENNCPHLKEEGYNFFDLLFDYRFSTHNIKILE